MGDGLPVTVLLGVPLREELEDGVHLQPALRDLDLVFARIERNPQALVGEFVVAFLAGACDA